MNTITIGGQPVARSVAGALGRLELAVAADADCRADVDFLRDRINAAESQRDELVESLRRQPWECHYDVLNPCWNNRPTDVAGKHWGGGQACPSCHALAVLAKLPKDR